MSESETNLLVHWESDVSNEGKHPHSGLHTCWVYELFSLSTEPLKERRRIAENCCHYLKWRKLRWAVMKTNEPLKEPDDWRWWSFETPTKCRSRWKIDTSEFFKTRKERTRRNWDKMLEIWNKEFFFKIIWENGRESDLPGVLCSLDDDSFTDIAERSSQVLIRVPSRPFCWRKIARHKASRIQISGENPLLFCRKESPNFSQFLILLVRVSPQGCL